MNCLFDFIVKPVGEKYNNTIKIENKDLIVNTKIENWKFVNRLAEVVQTPLAFNAGIKKGDKVIVHQNVFRTFYDMRGEKKKSRSFLKDDLHLCAFDQIYLYNNGLWNTVGDRCFIKPIKNKDELETKKELSLVGILKYGNSSLEALKITPGDIVGFTPNSEWEFVIEDELLYCMKSNDIVIKYECKGNEEEYNPSWAKGS